jgi:hypothetical protein
MRLFPSEAETILSKLALYHIGGAGAGVPGMKVHAIQRDQEFAAPAEAHASAHDEIGFNKP